MVVTAVEGVIMEAATMAVEMLAGVAEAAVEVEVAEVVEVDISLPIIFPCYPYPRGIYSLT